MMRQPSLWSEYQLMPRQVSREVAGGTCDVKVRRTHGNALAEHAILVSGFRELEPEVQRRYPLPVWNQSVVGSRARVTQRLSARGGRPNEAADKVCCGLGCHSYRS